MKNEYSVNLRLTTLAMLAKPQAWRLAWLVGLPAMLRIALQAGLLWSGALALQAADTHYVSLDGTNDATGGYTNWAGAATQIQWAVNVATDGDTVLVSNGTYNLTNEIDITTNITVRSLNGTNFTFINGNYPLYTNRCVFMSGTSVLDGFTISNGFLTNFGVYPMKGVNVDYPYQLGGAGIGIRGPATVKNCYIYKNYITNFGGGGIHVSTTPNVIISNCTVVSNTCSANKVGGGIYLDSAYDPGLLIDSYISGNIGGDGGGVAIFNEAGRITNCTIAGNTAILQNGGFTFQNTTAVAGNLVVSNNTALVGRGGGKLYGSRLINSIIINNKAFGGGGQTVGGIQIEANSYMSNCQVIGNSINAYCGGVRIAGSGTKTNVVANCIIANNVADRKGGGIAISLAGLVKNCLIYCNTNGNEGGGVALYQVETFTNVPNGLINCTIVNNKGAKGAGIYAEGGFNYIDNCIVVSNVTSAGAQNNISNTAAADTNNYWHTCAPDILAPNQGNITDNPLFIEQTNYNYRLGSGSPGINRGTNQAWMTGAFDLDGHRRMDKFSGQVDMGCYEYLPRGTMYGFR